MFTEFLDWLRTSDSFHSAFCAETDRLGEDASVLAVGPYSLSALPLLSGRQAKILIDVLMKEDGLSDEYLSRSVFTSGRRVPVPEGPYDLVYAPMCINYISKNELVSFLFDVFDSLKGGGRFIFSFMDSLKPDLGEGRPVPLWYSDMEVRTKYYTLQDMLNTLSAVGFNVTGVDNVEGDGIIHAVSLSCSK